MLVQSVQLLAAADSSVQSLPWVAHAVVGVCLGAGAVLWLAGKKVVKPIFALFGAAIGGGIGFLMLPTTIGSIGGFPSPYVGLAGGAIVGLIAGIATLRFALAIATGLAFGVAGLLVCATYLDLSVGLKTAPPATAPTTAPTSAAPSPMTSERFITEGVAPVAHRVKKFVGANSDHLKDTWGAQQEPDRVVLGVSSLGAGLFGFFLALFTPARSTSLATAMTGSAIVLACSVWLLNAFEGPGRQYLDQGPMVWLAVWAVAAILGLVAQMRSGASAEHAGAPT